MGEPSRDRQLVRMTFPRDQFDLIDLARTFRYIDYLWADSVQVMLAVAGVGYIPARPRIARPPIARVAMSSPLWVEVLLTGGVGGGMTTAWWFFRYAVQNPNAIGSWWNDVKIGRDRSQAELDQFRESNRRELGGQREAVDQALRLGSGIASQRGALQNIDELAIDRGLPERRDDTALAPTTDDRSPRQVSEPVESDLDALVERYRRDARNLVDNAGIPDIAEDSQ